MVSEVEITDESSVSFTTTSQTEIEYVLEQCREYEDFNAESLVICNFIQEHYFTFRDYLWLQCIPFRYTCALKELDQIDPTLLDDGSSRGIVPSLSLMVENREDFLSAYQNM